MSVARLADKYIARDGSVLATPSPEPHATAPAASDGVVGVTLSATDYQRLLLAAQSDDMIGWCDQCGAWMCRDDPTWVDTEDWRGCMWSATGEERYRGDCRMSRIVR